MSSSSQVFSRADHNHMARAIRLAWRGLYTSDPNPRVGCVLVRNGRVVGEGWHRRAGEGHAEIEALRAADQPVNNATAYVTLEPCCHHGKTPPCTQALIDAGISRVVVAMQDPNPKVAGKGLRILESAGIDIACGLLDKDAEALNPGFIKRMKTGLPRVFSKLAMSLDGRTALASGESRWITGESARFDVHHLRARSSAILVGIDTILADDPLLTARLPAGEDVKQPLRVIADSQLRLRPDAKMVKVPGRIIVCTTLNDMHKQRRLIDAGFEVKTLPAWSSQQVDLHALLFFLGKLEINEVMVEAGRTLNGALVQARLIDELIVYIAPCLLGDQGRALCDLAEINEMSDRIDLKLQESRQIGADLRLRYQFIAHQ